MQELAALSQTIVLAAGGTGGHLFPAEGLAEVLLKQGHRVILITDKRFSNYTTGGYKGALNDVELYIVRAGSLAGGIKKKLTGIFDVGLGVLQARRLLGNLKPDVVVGFGGYPSFPTMLAASGLRIPTLIHEQNAVLGKANRNLQSKVDRIATSYPNTTRLDKKQQTKVVMTGNPVRAGVRALHDIPYPELMADGTIRILVIGGSQGASIFSQIMPAAMATLPPALRNRVRIDQQCREADLEVARTAYAALGISVDLASFFNDIPSRLASAHLVISRAGASSVAELTVAGRPAILVPYPSAADNHQMFNAQYFEEAGAGWVIPQEGLTAAALSARIEAFLNLPNSLSKAARNAKLAGRVEAAQDLAKEVLALAQGKRHKKPSKTANMKEFAA